MTGDDDRKMSLVIASTTIATYIRESKPTDSTLTLSAPVGGIMVRYDWANLLDLGHVS